MKYNIEQSNEFLDNYKPMQFASKEKKMEALCTDNSNKLFSIGDDGKFYITYEKNEHDTGWEKKNLITKLEDLHKGKSVTAKTFAISKDIKANTYFLAVAINVDNENHLYIAKDGSEDSPNWVKVPFDDNSVSGNISINELYTSSLNSKEYLITDITIDNDTKIIKRYFIDCNSADGSKKWIAHPLPSDFQKVYACTMGRAYKESVDGIYTLGSISNSKQLIYTPLYNFFNPEIAPSPVRLTLEEAQDSLATLRENKTGYTHLFTCGNGSIYFYPSTEQKYNAKGYKILSDESLYNIKNLYSYEVNGKKMIWVLNNNGDLSYCFSYADYDKLNNPNVWSKLVPILNNIQYAYAYPNSSNLASNYFAYDSNSTIKLSTESPDTSLWNTQSINLVSLDGPAKKFNSYCTRIEITDENKMPVANKNVILKATDYCNVYVNNKYYSFTNEPISVKTDERGLVKIIQQAESTASANFNVVVNDKDGISNSIDISPQTKQLDKLTSLNTLDKLKNAKTGSGKNLVPADVPDENIEAVANSMDIFAEVAASLPQDGSVVHDTNTLKAINYSNTSHKGIFVLRVNNGKISSYKGDEALKNLPPRYLQASKQGFGDKIVYACSEVLNFIKNAACKVFDIVVEAVSGAWNFIVTIGEEVYSFVIKTINEVISCIETIFEFIKVTIELIIDFIKFIFNWDDIERTKDIVKKTVSLSVNSLKNTANIADEKINNTIDKLIKKISEMADLDSSSMESLNNTTITSMENSYTPEENTNVTDMYLTDYFLDNFENAYLDTTYKSTLFSPVDSITDDIDNAFGILADTALEEADIVKELITDLYENIFKDEKFLEYNIPTLLEKIAAIISKSALATCGNVVSAAANLFNLIADMVLEAVNKPIKIPVLSTILEDVLGVKPFSILDILCLLPAVASTAIFKITTGEAPFTEEFHDYYMSLNSFDDYNSTVKNTKLNMLTAKNPDSISNSDRALYGVFHILAGFVGFLDMTLQAICIAEANMDKPKGFLRWGAYSCKCVLGFIDIGIMGWGIAVFSPVSGDNGFDTALQWTAYIIIGIKALLDAANLVTCVDFSEDFKTRHTGIAKFVKVSSIISDVIKGIATVFEMLLEVVSIGYYIYEIIKNNVDGKYANLVIFDCVSVLICDCKDALDISLNYVKASSNPIVFVCLELAREGCAFGYSSGQIAVGIAGCCVLEPTDK